MTTNPWDVIERVEGESDPDKLYLSIGRALSAWEWMEQSFAHLFGFFCGGEDTLPARRAYGAVITFRGRSEMLRSVAEAYFYSRPDHAMKDRFFALLNLASNFSARRNEIAHGIVTIAYFISTDGSPIRSPEKALEGARWLLCPPDYATNKNVLIPIAEQTIGQIRRKFAYASAQVDHYHDEFRKLHKSQWDFMLAWANRYPDENILPPA